MPRTVSPVDVEVGRRVRDARKERSLSQSALAEQIGVKYQQIQRYENGVNRISASRLLRISQALGLPLSALLPDAVRISGHGDASAHVSSPKILSSHHGASESPQDVAQEGRNALQAYFAIKNPELRLWVVQMMASLAKLT